MVREGRLFTKGYGKMKLKAVSGMMLILLFIGILTLAFNVQQVKSEPTTWTVDDDGEANFQTIQEAINAASPNDTIYVYNGTYYEKVVINKNNLTLIGENKDNTIINGSGLEVPGNLVVIVANNVDISGFTVTNPGGEGIISEDSWYCKIHDNIVCLSVNRSIAITAGGNNSVYNNIVHNSSDYGGIDVIGSNNNTIYNNIAYFSRWGISTNHGSYNRIYNNTVHSNVVGIHIDWPSTGNIIYNNNVSLNIHTGIKVINEANGTVIHGNIISESDCGIWLANSPSNNISGNNITTNNDDGIYLQGSSNNSIVGNNITNNDHGIRLTASSSHNTVQGNNIIANNLVGIYLNESSENNVLGNDITENNVIGIYLAYSSNYNRISGNNITEHSSGVVLFESSNNSFYYNNFVNNTHQVFTGESILPPNIWDNGYPSGGNYWSDYAGEDADGDGIGDTPYVIDPNNQDNYPLWTRIIRVPEDYSTIEEAIEAAAPGDTITIAPGIYNESLVINKTLRILGIKGSDPEFAGGGSGIAVTLLPGASGSTVAGIVITDWDQGVFIKNCSDCKIYDNIISLMDYSGMALEGNNAANNFIYSNTFQDNSIAINLTESSTGNTIHSNAISLNDIGLDLVESSGNTIYANTISENAVGINMSNSNDNTIYWNNFESNTQQVILTNSLGNVWDNGYPSGGNYWSNYTGEDANGDGIGDTPHEIDANNIDRYPLMEPWPYEIKTSVGGIWVPVNKIDLLAPYIGLTILLAVAVLTVVYVKKRKRKSEINF